MPIAAPVPSTFDLLDRWFSGEGIAANQINRIALYPTMQG
jgi:hypothetical protein